MKFIVPALFIATFLLSSVAFAVEPTTMQCTIDEPLFNELFAQRNKDDFTFLHQLFDKLLSVFEIVFKMVFKLFCGLMAFTGKGC